MLFYGQLIIFLSPAPLYYVTNTFLIVSSSASPIVSVIRHIWLYDMYIMLYHLINTKDGRDYYVWTKFQNLLQHFEFTTRYKNECKPVFYGLLSWTFHNTICLNSGCPFLIHVGSGFSSMGGEPLIIKAFPPWARVVPLLCRKLTIPPITNDVPPSIWG